MKHRPVLLKWALQAEGIAVAKAGRYSSVGSFRARPLGGMRGQAAVLGPHSHFLAAWVLSPSLVSLVGRVEGSLSRPPHQDPWVQAGAGDIRMGRGPGSGPNPFLRASSFCLRADEVGLIMTNLEKANQVSSCVLGLVPHMVGGSARLGGQGYAQLVFTEPHAMQSAGAGRCLGP